MQPAIIYEDEDIIVCKKPAGVATQTRRIGQADMESLLKNYRASKGELPYIGVVHRLDQPVEGIMVFAKNKEAAADLSRQIKTKLADKYYYAMTDGVPEKKKGTLEDELLQNGKTNTSEVVERGTPQAKHASLSYEVVEQDGKHAVLRIKLDTGTHMHNFYHAMHARPYQLKSYLCSQLWFPTVQDVLHADWQEVWHSPHPPFFTVFCNLLVFNVFTCFMMLLSFFVISAHMGYAICPLPVILCIYSLSRGVLLTYTV